MSTLGVFQFLGAWEWVIITAIALLIFGRRLPGVARSLGRSIVEFRRGLAGVTEEDAPALLNSPRGASSTRTPGPTEQTLR